VNNALAGLKETVNRPANTTCDDPDDTSEKDLEREQEESASGTSSQQSQRQLMCRVLKKEAGGGSSSSWWVLPKHGPKPPKQRHFPWTDRQEARFILSHVRLCWRNGCPYLNPTSKWWA
jgi:hypothetical protein